jgi:hypothetical protein
MSGSGGIFEVPTMVEFNDLAARISKLEAIVRPDHQSGYSVLTSMGDGPVAAKHAVVVLYWKPSRVVVDNPNITSETWNPEVTIRDDGFEVGLGIFGSDTIHWTAYK